MLDFTAGHISSEEARELISAVAPHFAAHRGLELYAGVQYRHALVCRDGDRVFSNETKTQPPHDIPDRPIAEHLPQGPGAQLLIELMESSRPILAAHPVNRARIEAGNRPATQVWLWGQGKAPSLRPFEEVYGKRGSIISAVDLVRGVGVLLGWERIDVAGATGYLDTDYEAKGRAGVEALRDHDLVCVHVEAPDEASHEGKADEKVRALERIDEHIVGPLLDALRGYPRWRILVSPDHRTTLATRAHAYGMVPFAMAGTGIEPHGQASYDEVTAESSGVAFERGHELMRAFLG
jgi:2,3-bisphosphoglycerate-independent phosphoglycerate mutase